MTELIGELVEQTTSIGEMSRLYFNNQYYTYQDVNGTETPTQALDQQIQRFAAHNHPTFPITPQKVEFRWEKVVGRIAELGRELNADAFSFTELLNVHGDSILGVLYHKVLRPNYREMSRQ